MYEQFQVLVHPVRSGTHSTRLSCLKQTIRSRDTLTNQSVPQAKRTREPREKRSTAESVVVILACRLIHVAQEASEPFVKSILNRVSLLLLCLFCLSFPRTTAALVSNFIETQCDILAPKIQLHLM